MKKTNYTVFFQEAKDMNRQFTEEIQTSNNHIKLSSISNKENLN